jgi:hypothetical protein
MHSARMELFLLAVVSMVAIACGAAPGGAPGAEAGKTGEAEVSDASSVVVMGVSPSMRLRAYLGWNEGDSWEGNEHATPMINELPGEGGYVVARIPPSVKGEAYGILRILPSMVNALTVCTDGRAAVFEVPKNAVVYIGDFTLTFDGSYGVEVGYDFEKAAAFMKSAHPELAGRLAKGRARVAKVTKGQCDGKPVSFVAK